MLDLRKLGTDVRVRYQRVDKAGTENDKTLVQVDVNKDGDVEAGEDFEVELSGLHTLGVDDFALTGDNVQVVEVTDIVVAWRPGNAGISPVAPVAGFFPQFVERVETHPASPRRSEAPLLARVRPLSSLCGRCVVPVATSQRTPRGPPRPRRPRPYRM